MKSTIIIVTHVVNDAVTHGFVPTAKTMGLEVILITDHKLKHLKLSEDDQVFSPDEILECDVFNPLELIETIANQELQPNAIFSNSDHLQTSTAICAQFFGVPAKDWKVTLKAKNKYLTRQVLNEKLLPNVASQLLYSGSAPALDFPFPVVAKPKEGVASIDVQRCNSQSELERYCEHFWQKNPTTPILVETFLQGSLITVETLGDGENVKALGGFDVELSEPPFFIETAATWNGPLSVEYRDECVRQLLEFGVGLGVCHSEFIITESGPVLIEINYRSIGDGREFLLDNLSQGNWFSTILNLHLGKELDSEFQMNGSANVHYVVAGQSGVIEGTSTSFLEREDDIVIQQQVLKQVGENFTQSFSNKDYLARISVVSPSGENLEPTLQKTISQFDLKAASEVTA
ncbi:ATP-grasp domain-containing protein [Vibrio aquimaris]|uniref:Argininosuccinate lyase n=1 Tax=Vibrio aquimaris TaxID=2587862 RepID=A0A5P9CHU1_9VIBR|nr:ATP-grasp domain-containing protein [Vibrio aquimaris]QFT25814.1 argininosuccinate lyase [Vibrio aquimaris]